jgi:TRAP transporter TAXI family solute receptor
VGGAIARTLNRNRDEHGLRCMVEITDGSSYNLDAVAAGQLHLGLVQSDGQYRAVSGLAEWEGRARKDIRHLLSLHNEYLTIVAAEDTGIRTLADLRGKRVSLGSPGSGTRRQAIEVLTHAGLDHQSDLQTVFLDPSEAPGLLQEGQIDAFFFTVGHPNGAILEASLGPRKIRFLPVPHLDRILERYPFYSRLTLPTQLYPGAVHSSEPIQTVGVVTTLVASAQMPEDLAYLITRELFEHLDDLKKLHPTLAELDPRRMVLPQSAPFHPGALRYYRETGFAQ